eukprot:sb/3474058/
MLCCPWRIWAGYKFRYYYYYYYYMFICLFVCAKRERERKRDAEKETSSPYVTENYTDIENQRESLDERFGVIGGLYISDVKILFGTLEQVKQQNPHLFKRPAASVYYEMITRKLGFPAVINPTDWKALSCHICVMHNNSLLL